MINASASLAELEALLRPPLVASKVAQANRALVSIARNVGDGRIANLTMKLMSAVHASNEGAVALLFAQLRAARAETEKSLRQL